MQQQSDNVRLEARVGGRGIIVEPQASRNIVDLERAAFTSLPSPIYPFLQGRADYEVFLRANRLELANYAFVPTFFNNVSNIGMTVELFGRRVSMPMLLSPTGGNKMFHHLSERAGARANVFYNVSGMETTDLESIAGVADGPRIFRPYVFKDRGFSCAMVQHAKAAAGYDALCITIAPVTHGNPKRDLLTKLTVPPCLTGRSWLSLVTRSSWAVTALRHPRFRLADFETHADETSRNPKNQVDELFDKSLTRKSAEWLAREWDEPIISKGICGFEDAHRAAAINPQSVMIFNHGGRQLDRAAAPLRQVSRIRDAVGMSLRLIATITWRRGGVAAWRRCQGDCARCRRPLVRGPPSRSCRLWGDGRGARADHCPQGPRDSGFTGLSPLSELGDPLRGENE